MNINSGLTYLSIIALFGLSACGSSNSDSTGSTPSAVAGVSAEAIDASSDNYKVVKLSGDKNLQISLGKEEKDVYLLFSNSSNIKHTATISHNQKVLNSVEVQKTEFKTPSEQSIMHTPVNIQAFNSQLALSDTGKKSSIDSQKLSKMTIDDVEGSTKEFYMDANSTEVSVTATARKVIKDIDTAFGKKSLTIWVENNEWIERADKSSAITQKMVDTLANKFLSQGLDNDIYDWVTNIFGEEWGEHNFPTMLIDESDHISILLTDIAQDKKENGGVIGYFYSKDNYQKGSCFNHQCDGSNERIMFYIDSVMYANGGESWDENSFWSQQIFSTLAHEFQHMIYFYQKNTKQGIEGTDIWLNEMLSESTEDLVAVKMGVDGPRNVLASRGDAGSENNYNGRYPIFNQKNILAPSFWKEENIDWIESEDIPYYYSSVSSFGAYLLRNYGGAKLLHDIVYSNLTNEASLMDAVHKHINGKSKTFDDLIHEWGVAVLLSKSIEIPRDSGYLYNAGDFISSERNGINYSLGSIDFFNYAPIPNIKSTMGEVAPHANYYYKVGEKLKGNITVDLVNTAGLNVSVVIVK